MYENYSHSISDRIVNIYQPHVRPIVRGKVRTSVEFGAKVSISLIDGFSFVDRIAVEGKRRFSLALIMTKLAHTSEVAIMVSFIGMNLEKILSGLLSFLLFVWWRPATRLRSIGLSCRNHHLAAA